MKYILSYENGEDWEDSYRYNFLIDGDSIESVRQKVVDAFAEAVSTPYTYLMIVGGYLYPMPYVDPIDEIKTLDFEVIAVEDYLKNHMPEKA